MCGMGSYCPIPPTEAPSPSPTDSWEPGSDYSYSYSAVDEGI